MAHQLLTKGIKGIKNAYACKEVEMSEWEETNDSLDQYKPVEVATVKIESLAKGDFKITVSIMESPRALEVLSQEVSLAYRKTYTEINEFMKGTDVDASIDPSATDIRIYPTAIE